MNLQDMKVSGLSGYVPDETAEAAAAEVLDFKQLARFINEDEGFWNEMLTMQNEVHSCSPCRVHPISDRNITRSYWCRFRISEAK